MLFSFESKSIKQTNVIKSKTWATLYKIKTDVTRIFTYLPHYQNTGHQILTLKRLKEKYSWTQKHFIDY